MNIVIPPNPKSSFPHYHFAVLLAVAVSSIFFTIWAMAGSLNPSGGPAATMKSLQNIYDSLASTSFDSSAITQSSNGSAIQEIREIITNNIQWASSSNDIYMTSSGNVGIGDSTPTSKLTIQANNTNTDILTIASSSGSEYLSMEYNGHTLLTGSAAEPKFIAETRGPTPGTSLDAARGISVQGKYAYVANQNRDSLAVIDISNPASPSFLSEVRGGTKLDAITDVFVAGNYAYVTTAPGGNGSLSVINISNPASPSFVGEVRPAGATLAGAVDIFVSGKYAYVVTDSSRRSLAVIDISNPASPSFVAETRGPIPATSLNGAAGVFVSGHYAYVANRTRDSLAVIDISNPASPSFLSETFGAGRLDGARYVVVSGRYAYVSTITRDSLAVIDISNPASPSFVAETRGPTPGTSLDTALGLFASGKYLYVAVNSRDSLAVIDISNPASPSFIAETRGPTPGTSLDGAAHVFVSGRYAYVTGNSRDSLAAIDIGSLTAPQIEAGTIRTENLGVISLATFDNGILLKGGISVGEGALIGGHFSVSGASSSFLGKLGVGITSGLPARLSVVGSAGNYDIFNVASSSGTSLFRITKGGNVGIGTSTPGLLTHIRSSSDTDILRLQDSDGTCDHNPEAGSETVTCSSDQRLKENIVDAPSILSDLAKFRIREFNVISSDDRMIGVIAQEVQSIFPDLVSSRSNGYLAVEQPTTWQLVKGLQEVDVMTAALETKILALPSLTPQIPPPAFSDRSGFYRWIVDRLSALYSMIITEGIVQIGKGLFQELETDTIRADSFEFINSDGNIQCMRIVGAVLQSSGGECPVTP